MFRRKIPAGEPYVQVIFAQGEILPRFIGPRPFVRLVIECENGFVAGSELDLPAGEAPLPVDRKGLTRKPGSEMNLPAPKVKASAANPFLEWN